MFKVLCIIAVLTYSQAYLLTSEICEKKPKEKHCLIEWAVRDRWPHTVRYVYDWDARTCMEIRWSNHCEKLPAIPTSNNFATQEQCMNECSGWA